MESLRRIDSAEGYAWALAEVTKYFEREPQPGTPDGDRFDLLSDLIESYEDKHYPVATTRSVGRA
jgi:HTH-type transcriptional regulator / antitoxin HigA